jgi:hypothetical protein
MHHVHIHIHKVEETPARPRSILQRFRVRLRPRLDTPVSPISSNFHADRPSFTRELATQPRIFHVPPLAASLGDPREMQRVRELSALARKRWESVINM